MVKTSGSGSTSEFLNTSEIEGTNSPIITYLYTDTHWKCRRLLISAIEMGYISVLSLLQGTVTDIITMLSTGVSK